MDKRCLGLLRILPPVEPPFRFYEGPLEEDPQAELPEARAFINLDQAREEFRDPGEFELSGEGMTVAVLDTGLRVTHVDFRGRVPFQLNLTPDNGGDRSNAADGQGHGTNVGGIIVAGGLNNGIAPAARIVPIKVLQDTGGGAFDWVEDALRWVDENHEEHGITVVNMSLGDSGNHVSDAFGENSIGELITSLREKRIAVVVSAGNDFFTHSSQQGMGFPAIFRDTISVGAVYDSNAGGFGYSSGARAESSAGGQITPFSQRIHESTNNALRTDIFAPGAPIASSGITSDQGISIQHGTSQAAPVTSGLILLMQQYYKYRTGGLPTVEQIEEWLRSGGGESIDNYGDRDNVVNTGLSFTGLDALGSMTQVREALKE